MEYNTIIFDLGAVLIDWNPRYYYRKVFRSEEAMEYFLENITTSEWNEEQDGGRSIKEAVLSKCAEFPEYTTEISNFYSKWESMLNGALPYSVQILESLILNPKYKVYALTNWSAETWPTATSIFDFLAWFDGVLVSGHVNLKKPDSAIFQMMLDRFNIDKESALFIDDNFRNVIAARDFGIDTIHFKDSYQLSQELLHRNIIHRNL